jgi:site-specific DNA-methyltransferase (adenine-specific)
MNEIYNEDVLLFLNKIPNESIDLLLTDPPYNMNKEYWDKFNSLDDFLKFTYGWIDAVIPKIKKKMEQFTYLITHLTQHLF